MLKQLLSFLKNPNDCALQKPRVVDFIKLWFIYLFFGIPVALLLKTTTTHFQLDDLMKIQVDFSSLKTIVIFVLIAPVFEEIIFRSLLRFTKKNLIRFSIATSLLIVYFISQLYIPNLIITAVVLSGILILTSLYTREKIEQFIHSKFSYFFYATAILFGLGHAFNFGGNIYVLLALSFILGGGQLIAGLILGFIRMKYGLIYSIIFHALINSIAVLAHQ